jgi:hypothetical protein
MNKEALRLEVEAVLEAIKDALEEAVETVEVAFEDEDDEEILPGDCSFPIVWSVGSSPCDGEGGEPIEDPMVLRVHSAEELDEPNTKYDVSLQDAVSSLIFMIGSDDEDMDIVAMQVRDALSELADQITMALELNANEE